MLTQHCTDYFILMFFSPLALIKVAQEVDQTRDPLLAAATRSISQTVKEILLTTTTTIATTTAKSTTSISAGLNTATSQFTVLVQSTQKSTDFRYEAHAILIGVIAIALFILLLIVFITSTCVIIRVMMKKQPKPIKNAKVLTNTYMSTSDSLITNSAYSRPSDYDKLMRIANTPHQVSSPIAINHQQISSSVSMPEVRFSQSLPLPEIPQSLPLPSPIFPLEDLPGFLPKSKTISEFNRCTQIHVYDLPFQNIPKVPQEYEKPV